MSNGKGVVTFLLLSPRLFGRREDPELKKPVRWSLPEILFYDNVSALSSLLDHEVLP